MSQPNKKDALGKGIRSLLQNIDSDLKNTAGALSQEVVEQASSAMRIPLEQIEVNPKQPRRDFDETALNELAASIRIHDIIQPLTVTRMPSGKFRLIAGERRFRASKLAGLKDVPVYIRQANDTELLELSLLENLQRKDLNAIEVALSYKRLMDELEYTQEQVAELAGKLETASALAKSAWPNWQRGMATLLASGGLAGFEPIPEVLECLWQPLCRLDDDVGAADAVQAWLHERNLCQAQDHFYWQS